MEDLFGVLNVSPDAVLIVDEEGVIQQANQNVEQVLGYDPDEIEGLVVEELLFDEDRENHVQYRREYMASPEPRPMGRELDLYAKHKDGSRVPVDISLGPIEHGDDQYIVATIGDITERRRRARELERQNERLEEFTDIVSHDLRNPLNVAKGRLRLAMEDVESEHFPAIEQSFDRMESLIEDLLTLAREGRRTDATKRIDLGSIVEECWQNVAPPDASFSMAAMSHILADERQLKQLIENMLRNAVAHGGSAVSVRVGEMDGGFFIEDSGPGIPADDRSRIFTRGYSTSAEGTGLGLAIVNEVVEAHDWEVFVTEAKSGGARFEITGIHIVD